MSDVVSFLETMGSNPSIGRLSPADYAAAVAQLGLDDAQASALIARDRGALDDLIGSRKQCMLALAIPEDEPADDEPGDDDEDGDSGGAKPDPDRAR